METARRAWKQLVAIAALFVFATHALADPPGRVGRITLIEGDVKFYADQEDGWQPARLNVPVTSENSIWTEGRSRAEWKVGPTAIRLDHDTVVDIQKLNDTEFAIYLQRGTANIRIGLIEKGEVYRVHTPEGTVTLRSSGSYRFEADMDKGESSVAVYAGRARIDSRAGTPWVDAGRMALMDRSGARMESIARTNFDDWVQVLDERWNPAISTHVSPFMTGHEELDANGTWEEEIEYGRVWVPRVVVDWAPYRYGHWRYVRPWGWTWIDDAPWGFAATHYGRWVQVRGRWAWWPGTRRHRPIYSPALVAWVGGSDWTVSFASGNGHGIGWFPLAPYEAFVPWYTHSPTYVYNINHIHINRPVHTRPPRQYVNHKPGVTVVSPATFQSAAPVATNQARIRGESAWNRPAVQDGAILPPRRTEPDRNTGRQPGSSGKPLDVVAPSPQSVPQPMPMPQRGEVLRPNKPVPADPRPAANVAPAQVPVGSPSDSMGSRPAPESVTKPASSPVQIVQPAIPEPQPRYTKPRSAGEPAAGFPQPAPSRRDAQTGQRQDINRPDRVDRVDRTGRTEKPRVSESAVVRPQPGAQPTPAPVAPAKPTQAKEPQAKEPQAKEPRVRDEASQPDRPRNPGRTQER